MTSDPEEFLEGVYRVVEAIPAGRVMSYGSVARALNSAAARRVGTLMSLHGHELPWWRVLRADGTVAPGLDARARTFFAAEATPLRSDLGGRVRVGTAAFLDPAELPSGLLDGLPGFFDKRS